MAYTVNQLAKLAGVTIRTLHHYDEIGLLRPSYQKENGYRYYEEKELIKLQQILFFRELEFPLEDIKKMMTASDFDAAKALTDQKHLLTLKKIRLERILTAIDDAIKREGGEIMNDNNLFDSFDEEEFKKSQEEAKARWGNTEAMKQSQERTKHWTKDDYKRIARKGEEWTKKLAELRDRGLEANNPKVQEMIGQHYEGLKTFYEPNYEMYRGLGQMYVDDPRFTAYYEKFGKGLAIFMRDAMHAFIGAKEAK
jgi:MerR family transcriptional regulator, thiopeptide resistance regulator